MLFPLLTECTWLLYHPFMKRRHGERKTSRRSSMRLRWWKRRSFVEFLGDCQSIETTLGRVRHGKWGARTIDIDLVYSPDVTCRTAELTLPHPYLTQRAFVLVPLQEIAPHLSIGGEDIQQLLLKLPERWQIIKTE